MTKILITGRFDPDYNRTAVIIAGLQRIGVDVIVYPYQKKSRSTAKELKSLAASIDFVFLPSFTTMDVRFVKRHTRKSLIFDPLISKYMTKVMDYKTVHRFSIRALKNYYKDKLAMQAADLVVTDTKAHGDYFSSTFKIDRNKFRELYIGIDSDQFYPLVKDDSTGKFKVGFYGSFAPLQGIDVIVKVANLLKEEPIDFEVVGAGFTEKKVVALINQYKLQNIQMPGRVSFKELNKYINSYDVCLGIFGEGLKADVVIPNKIYHYAACGKAVISKRTTAVQEIFTDQENIMLTDGSPEDLAAAIKKLYDDRALVAAIGKRAHQLMQENYQATMIAQRLISLYQSL